MRRESDFFGEQELVLIYMARRLRDALAVEKIFDAVSLDYLLETGPYESGLVFRSTKMGVFFYARVEDEGRARTLLIQSGYHPYRER